VKGRFSSAVVVAVAVLGLSLPVLAHHGNAAFDTGKKLDLKGTVTEWVWANPHCWLKFDVKDDSGKVTNWVAETSNAADMLERGWSKYIMKPGDEVTVSLEPVKNGKPVGRVLSVLLPNGHTLGMAYLKR
jgi:Family of unknown function (DUF6152)